MSSTLNPSRAHGLEDMPRQFAEKASEFGRKAVDAADHSRGAVANALDQAASSVRSVARGNARTGEYAERFAGALGRTAGYIRNTDVRHMTADCGEAIRSNPGASLIAAAAVGLLVGVVLRSSNGRRV